MSKKMTNADLKAKIEWEGGVVKAWEYGIKPADIEDPDVAEMWAEMSVSLDEAFSLVYDIEEKLDEE